MKQEKHRQSRRQSMPKFQHNRPLRGERPRKPAQSAFAPSLLDVAICLYLASALLLFVLWLATTLVGISPLLHVPDWLFLLGHPHITLSSAAVLLILRALIARHGDLHYLKIMLRLFVVELVALVLLSGLLIGQQALRLRYADHSTAGGDPLTL